MHLKLALALVESKGFAYPGNWLYNLLIAGSSGSVPRSQSFSTIHIELETFMGKP
jgi:hypothetical protein